MFNMKESESIIFPFKDGSFSRVINTVSCTVHIRQLVCLIKNISRLWTPEIRYTCLSCHNLNELKVFA